MALSVKNDACKTWAMILAMVVLPTPGGPHKIMEGSLPLSIAVRRMLPLPVKCSWPFSSSSVVGRRRSANGEVIIKVTKKAPESLEL